MNEDLEVSVVSSLMAAAGCNELTVIQSEDELPAKPVKFLVIRAHKASEPVHLFWLARQKNVLADGCKVVFTGIDKSSYWSDLVRIYRGTRFGWLFLLEYSAATKPGVCPSQRGMYMK